MRLQERPRMHAKSRPKSDDDVESDKYVQWELKYYEWVNYEGKEKRRPAPPGPHPDPDHKWNKHPGVELTMEDVDTANGSD